MRTGVITMVAALFLALGPATSAKITGVVTGHADLSSLTEDNPDAAGSADLVAYPRHAEVDLYIRHLHEGRKICLVWLSQDFGTGYLGGAFRAKDAPRLSTVVPGEREAGAAKLSSAKRVVLTCMPHQKALDYLRGLCDADLATPIHIVGQRVVRGLVVVSSP